MHRATNGAVIEIVDRGRGKQLSTCRITVQDVYPYVVRGDSDDQIRDAMPILTLAEIQAVRRYIADHPEGVAAEDRRIRERNAKLRNPPEVVAILRGARDERLARAAAKSTERNDADHPG
jgi:uncharacterized protein (DUF433 family)